MTKADNNEFEPTSQEDLDKLIHRGERLSIGDMAQLNGISVKTLRHYQDKGILEPAEVSKESGFRYYTLEQSFELDRILRYQNMGFTLSEIKQILENEYDVSLLPLFQRRLGELDRAIASRTLARDSLVRLLEGRNWLQENSTRNGIHLEWHPDHTALRFPILDEGYEIQKFYGSMAWCYVLRLVKHQIDSLGLPLELFDEVLVSIGETRLKNHDLRADHALVEINPRLREELSLPSEMVGTIPAGLFLTCGSESLYDKEGHAVEPQLIQNMLDYIEEHNLEIRGPYICEGNIDRVYHPGQKPLRIKAYIPVSIQSA